MRRSTSWLDKYRDRIVVGADPLLREALEIVGWDAYFIGAKVRRALDGRDRSQYDEEDCDSDPVQNDGAHRARDGSVLGFTHRSHWPGLTGSIDAGGHVR
jgi:hypothetical protein